MIGFAEFSQVIERADFECTELVRRPAGEFSVRHKSVADLASSNPDNTAKLDRKCCRYGDATSNLFIVVCRRTLALVLHDTSNYIACVIAAKFCDHFIQITCLAR